MWRCGVRVEAQSAPEGNEGGAGEGRGEVSGEFVVAGGNPTEVLSVGRRLPLPASARGSASCRA